MRLHGIDSIRQLSKLFGVRYQTAHNWYWGRTIPTVRHIFDLADMASLPHSQVIGEIQLHKILRDLDDDS